MKVRNRRSFRVQNCLYVCCTRCMFVGECECLWEFSIDDPYLFLKMIGETCVTVLCFLFYPLYAKKRHVGC